MEPDPPPPTPAQVWEHYSRECLKYAMPRLSAVRRIVTGQSTEFDIRDYNTQSVAFVVAFELFARHQHACVVTHVDCSNSAFAASACPTLSDLMESSRHLQYLNLCNSQIGYGGIRALSEGLHYMRSITHLNLSGCDMRDAGGVIVASALRNNDLCTELHLEQNQLGAESARALGQMLERNEVLQTLNLRWNSFFCETEFCELLAGVQKSTSLRDLNLAWNAIATTEAKVADAFEAMFKKQKSLETLDLQNNRMSQNLVALLDGVRKCKCIRTILMGGNPFTANDITEMLSALQSGATMRGQPKTLDLGRYQWIDQEQRLLLDKAVARNRGQLRIVYAGTMMQRPPEAVDFRWVLMRRMRTLALKPKKAKKRRDMGQFFLALQRELEPRDRTVDEFMGELKAFGAKLDDPLKAQVCAQFKHKSKDQVLHLEMAECYLQHFPTEWIEPIVKAPRPPPKKGKGKEKGKK